MNHNNHQHIKSFDANSKGKKRIKYLSAKQRAKKASADVYRSYKRRTGAASREERVHHPEHFDADGSQRSLKKRKTTRTTHITPHDYKSEGSKTAIVRFRKDDEQQQESDKLFNGLDDEMDGMSEDESDDDLNSKTTFAMELDLSKSRNGSQLFAKLYRDLYPLVQSLPEILHHVKNIVRLLLSYLLSTSDDPSQPSSIESYMQGQGSKANRESFVVNLATTDVLHLISVLARDLRHEIHPFVHDLILPRIINDLVNPPTIANVSASTTDTDTNTNTNTKNAEEEEKEGSELKEEEKETKKIKGKDESTLSTRIASSSVVEAPKVQQRNLDISVVEAAFRTISYILKYDYQEIIQETIGTNESTPTSSNSMEGCLELMRKHYGATLAHKQEFVRRLAAETFAPLIRKLRSNTARKKHIRRVIKSLAISAVTSLENELRSRDIEESLSSSSTLSSIIVPPRLERARDDAVNGVALLLFYVVRGVPGRLHSKANSTIKIVLNCLSLAENKKNNDTDSSDNKKSNRKRSSSSSKRELELEMYRKDMIYRVASKFIYYIRGHIHATTNFSPVWEELYTCTDSIIKDVPMRNSKNTISTSNASMGLHHIVNLVNESVSHGHGRLLRSDEDSTNDENANNLSEFLQKILGKDVYGQASKNDQINILAMLCSAWKVFPAHPAFTSRLNHFIKSITRDQLSRLGEKIEEEDATATVDPILVLANDLLPYVSNELATKQILPAILSIAAKRCQQDTADDIKMSPLRLLHAVATCNLRVDQSEEFQDHDDLFYIEGSTTCKLSVADKKTIIDYFLANGLCLKNKQTLRKECVRVGFLIRIVPFITLIGYGGELEQEDQGDVTIVMRVLKWILLNLKDLDSAKKAESDISNVFMVKSLLLEALALITNHCQSNLTNDKSIENILKKARKHANDLLFDAPRSLLTVKAVSKVAKELKNIGIQLNDEENETFELLNQNLRSTSHFLRLHTLHLLNTYPQRLYVVNHSDLDFTGDLDEETSYKPAQKSDSGGLSGKCDLMETLLQIETTPVNLKNERILSTNINRVEIIGRTAQLPVLYAEAASYHMFGLMHVKFQPLWKVSIRAIVAIASNHDVAVWTTIENQLRLVMEESFFTDVVTITGHVEINRESDFDSFIKYHHELYLQWDKTTGNDAMLFRDQIVAAQSQGRVSCHQTTDKITVFESVWKVLEGVPQLTTKKSRVIVPIFFQFLLCQYFIFHDEDPDAREFALASQIEKKEISSKMSTWSKETLSRRMLQKKLASFMRMFTQVKGMQQLYKHRLLLVIFISFLSNPDLDIAQMSLSCITNYKLPYVMPYKEELNGMLARGQMRETLTKFDLSLEGGTVDTDHREQIFPLIIRILFGRLSARGNGSKSSKDSPAARRAAILSFLSGLGQHENEIDYFVYMMVRTFIPKNVDMQIVDCGHQCKEHIMIMIQKAVTKELSRVHVQRQEGFLNLMSDVIKKLGFGVIKFVPVFTKLILTFIEHGESKRKTIKDTSFDAETNVVEVNHMQSKQSGKIRSLCFLRASELMGKFASATSFEGFKSRLWASLQPSLLNLSSSVVNADKPPSLLVLLETLSSHPKLINLLVGESNAVEAVFKCISEQSKVKVIDCALKFVDNLLTEGGLYEVETFMIDEDKERHGITLILNHLELLIGQFTKRLESGISFNSDEDQSVHVHKNHTANQLLTRELSILCRLSELLVHEKAYVSQGKEEVIPMMESLCKLLLPYLDFNCRLNDSSQTDILGILSSILPRIRKATALSHLQSFARLLGPNRSNNGLTSLETRQNIITCIRSITKHNDNHAILSLTKVTTALYDLAASHPKHIDESNYDKIVPVLVGLGSATTATKNWMYFVDREGVDSCGVKAADDFNVVKTLLPLMFYCLHMLYDQDGVVSRGSLKALKNLVTIAKQESSSCVKNGKKWLNLIQSSLVPRLLTGIKTRNINVRRSFILLLVEVATEFKSQDSPHFYGDLNALVREDDQNLDFFINITHIQIHRRARAMGRLRKLLQESANKECCQFSIQSLSNVLLPLAMHPVYDFEKDAEETYALESIATVGAISKHLPWGKYQNILWKALLEIPRFENKERYFIAMICSIIDSFHFDVKHAEGQSGGDRQSDVAHNEAIWKQINTRIIPKIESYLVKEKIERGGKKVKTLRAPIVLALANLFKKMPLEVFESKLPRLLTVICYAMANKDSNEREVARNTLSKLVISIGVRYLSDIVRELAITLSEGFKLHVRTTALHSVLLTLSQNYTCQNDASLPLPFDQCVPAMMDIIQQDIFGTASEMKEAESVKKHLVKEAMGSKSHSSLEIISKMILFKPSLHTKRNINMEPSASLSAIHSLVNPFLQRIRDPEVDSKTIGKVKECLTRIVIGISHNKTITTEEMLPFVYATVSPFLTIKNVGHNDGSDDSDDDEMHGLEVSKTSTVSRKVEGKTATQNHAVKKVFEWAPSQLKGPKSTKSAYDMKIKDKADLKKVQDGFSAPRLTGTSRDEALKSNGRDFNDPATSSAVSFALSLLCSHLKKATLGKKEMMVDPFVEILTQCVQYSKDTSAILLSLKCLQVILRLDLPSLARFRGLLASQTLRILSMTSNNTRDETVQSCFKTLTLLITQNRKEALKYLDNVKGDSSENQSSFSQSISKKKKPPLNDKQMQVLVSLVQAAIIDTEQHNATFSVIKAITSTQYVSAEYYDLMENMLKMTVQSQKQSVRQQAAKIFMQYLIEYPMGKQRIEKHLKQMVLNTKYEYEDGRQSALELVSTVIQKLPIPLLEEYTQVFFLPLVLQLVNDESKKCREAVSKCIVALLKRLSNQVLQSLHEYAVRWSAVEGVEGQQLRRTSIQIFGIFIEARLDFMKKGSRLEKVVTYVQLCLNNEIGSSLDHTSIMRGKGWEVTYFCLQTLEKLCTHLPLLARKDIKLWENVIKCLVHPHPWVKLISSRLIYTQFSGETSDKYATIDEKKNSSSIIMRIPGSLFDIARNLCFQLNSEEEQYTEELSTMGIKNLSWVIKIMDAHPSLCYKDDGSPDLAEDDFDDDEEVEVGGGGRKRNNPVTWLITRLSNIAKKRGNKRRESIFKCFASFASTCDLKIISSHLELMLEPLHRVISEVSHKEDNIPRWKRLVTSDTSSAADLPKDVMQLLEDVCGTELFMNALASIKSNARTKRETRKQAFAAEAVHNPEAAAKRKIERQEMEKQRKKRRVQERKGNRGVFTKKPRHIV